MHRLALSNVKKFTNDSRMKSDTSVNFVIIPKLLEIVSIRIVKNYT